MKIHISACIIIKFKFKKLLFTVRFQVFPNFLKNWKENQKMISQCTNLIQNSLNNNIIFDNLNKISGRKVIYRQKKKIVQYIVKTYYSTELGSEIN